MLSRDQHGADALQQARFEQHAADEAMARQAEAGSAAQQAAAATKT